MKENQNQQQGCCEACKDALYALRDAKTCLAQAVDEAKIYFNPDLSLTLANLSAKILIALSILEKEKGGSR